MTLDLSMLQPKKMEPWYELHLHEHKDLAEANRNAHFYSMLHSQRHDYKADLRLVLTEKDITNNGVDPFTLDAYRAAPSLRTALRVCKEVVIRNAARPGEELLLSTLDKALPYAHTRDEPMRQEINQWRPRSRLNTGEVASHVKTNILSRQNKGRDLGI